MKSIQALQVTCCFIAAISGMLFTYTGRNVVTVVDRDAGSIETTHNKGMFTFPLTIIRSERYEQTNTMENLIIFI